MPTPKKKNKTKHKYEVGGWGGKATACFCVGGRAGPGGSRGKGPAPPSLFWPPVPSGVEAPAPGRQGEEGWLEEVPRGRWPHLSTLATKKQQAETPGALTKTVSKRRWGEGCSSWGGRSGRAGGRRRCTGPAGPLGPSCLVPHPHPATVAVAAKPLVL